LFVSLEERIPVSNRENPLCPRGGGGNPGLKSYFSISAKIKLYGGMNFKVSSTGARDEFGTSGGFFFFNDEELHQGKAFKKTPNRQRSCKTPSPKPLKKRIHTRLNKLVNRQLYIFKSMLVSLPP
jgi:hypothetical protein